MDILIYASEHWVEWVFAIATGTLGILYRRISAQLQVEKQKNEAIADGVQSLLRESIVSNFNRYSERGYCPIYAKESIKKVYAAYHDLGGNDVATELYRKLLVMPEDDDGHDRSGAHPADVFGRNGGA